MTSTGRVRRSRRGSGGADRDCFSRPQRAVTATEPVAKRIVGPRRAVVAGQGDQVRATGRYLIQDMGGIPLADRVPWRVRVAQYRLRHQRGADRAHRQVQSADHGGLVLRPEIAALSMSGSSFLVAVNALLLRRLRLPGPKTTAA